MFAPQTRALLFISISLLSGKIKLGFIRVSKHLPVICSSSYFRINKKSKRFRNITDRNKHLASNATFTHSDVRHFFFVSIIYFNLLPQVDGSALS